MDVNETLETLRQLAAEMTAWEEEGEDPDEPGEYYRIASEMVAAFRNLDRWLNQGNFLPKPWAEAFLKRVENRALPLDVIALRTEDERRQAPGLPQGLSLEGDNL